VILITANTFTYYIVECRTKE